MADFMDYEAVTRSVLGWPADRRAALAHALIDSLSAQVLPTPRPAAPAPTVVQKPLTGTSTPTAAVSPAVSSPFSVTGTPAAKPASSGRGWIDETAHR